MRSLLSALCVLLVACTAPPASEQTPARPSEEVTASRPPAAACAPALTQLRPVTASLDLLPHRIGDQVLFGLDGAFVASSSSYPLGAGRRWWKLDAAGGTVGEIEDPRYGRVQQSPDGAQFVFSSVDPTSGALVTYVRDVVGGLPRLLTVGDLEVNSWIDPDRVLLASREGSGIRHAIHTRTLVDEIVFRPPAAPSVAAAGDDELFSLSGDLRWAIFTRWHSDDSLARIDLFDVRRQTYVAASLPLTRSWLAPRGDVLVWIDGSELRAMHLCDQRTVTLATVPKITTVFDGAIRFSSNGRYLSFAYGPSDELTAPERDVVVDLEHGTIANIAAPWGFVRQWSPGLDTVVLSRYGFHSFVDRLARFSMP